MTRSTLLANRLREVLLNGHWIANTNFAEQLRSISWQQSVLQLGQLNTIAALTYHINYYLAGLISAFETGKLEISDRYSFDVPPIQNAKDWDHLRDSLMANSERFAQMVDLLDDTTLDGPFINPQYGTCLRNIEAVVEHAYYHLGQISLIRKMQSSAAL